MQGDENTYSYSYRHIHTYTHTHTHTCKFEMVAWHSSATCLLCLRGLGTGEHNIVGARGALELQRHVTEDRTPQNVNCRYQPSHQNSLLAPCLFSSTPNKTNRAAIQTCRQGR